MALGPQAPEQTRKKYLAVYTLPTGAGVSEVTHRDEPQNSLWTCSRAEHGDLAGLVLDSSRGIPALGFYD